jgi:hypothetical protein
MQNVPFKVSMFMAGLSHRKPDIRQEISLTRTESKDTLYTKRLEALLTNAVPNGREV